jgi:hypothetical protein
MSKEEMANVPRFIGKEPLDGSYYASECQRCGWIGSSGELTEDAQCTRIEGDSMCLGETEEIGTDHLLGIIQATAQCMGEPVAWSYKVRVHAAGIGLVWRDKIEPEAPDVEAVEVKDLAPLFTRSDAGEVDRLNTVVEQQKSLIASLRAELRDAYSIDAAVQEEHLDLEAAAQKLAACMNYPWEHMPEQGRASMREHAKVVIDAAKSGASA